MALTSTTLFDIVGQTQSITFNNPGQVDQITYASNQVTFQTISTFNLSKSDLQLYIKYLIAFNNLLIFNFPAVSAAYTLPWPISDFHIFETNSGVQKIDYVQTSLGTQVININYLPLATSASFAARVSPVTVTVQEFLMCVYMLTQYSVQVGLN
jgi:hypothetical protein